jgi:hypothetical protein
LSAAAAIIREAAGDGLVLTPTPSGTFKARGPDSVLARWRPVLAENKAAIVAELSQDTGRTKWEMSENVRGLSASENVRGLLEAMAAENERQMLVLGVDIGARGALALVDAETGELIEVHDMPVLADGPKGRAAVNAALLAELVYRLHAGHAFVEAVGARPGEGAVGAFAFCRCRGVVEGVLGGAGVPATHIKTPPVL